MPNKPNIISRIERETGVTLTEGGDPGYSLFNGEVTFIHLDSQSLTRVPEAVVGFDCGLSLEDNLIAEIPANLGNNGGHDIYLNNNRIESLPPECLDWKSIPVWDYITSTFCVTLIGNPLKNPPPEIVKRGIEALRAWFTAQEESRSRTPSETAGRYSATDSLSPPLRQAKIFLCYRREDTQGFARSIYDRLAAKYGHEQVFRDIDSTPAGVRFSTWIESKVSQCNVMVVLIGNAWSEAKDRTGQRRLDSPKDWVRQEIEAALRRDIPIIPVRVQGVPMPSEDELPASIADLAGFQSAEVTDSRWIFDVELLIQAIDYLIASD